FSRYSSSSANNFGYTATYDSEGNAFGAGSVFAQGYITTAGAYDIDFNGASTDVGISKYTSDGLNRIYATYLGGNDTELPHSIIVNSRDELYIFGTTSSPDFPIDTLMPAIDTSYNGGSAVTYGGLGATYGNGSDIFVSRLSVDGTALLSSTYLGGSANDGLNDSGFTTFNYADEVRGEIEIDADDNVFIATCTASDDFPIVDGFQNTHAGGLDAVVVKMDENLTQILWSTYLGGSDDDAAYSLAIDTTKNIIIAGGTHSDDFTAINAYESDFQGGQADGFIARFHSTGTGLLQSTYLGTPAYDQIYFVDINNDNQVHIFGQTNGDSGLLVENAVYNNPAGGQMITKFDEDIANVIWSTRFGDGQGTPDISPTAFLVDLCNQIFLSGWGSPNVGNGQVNGTAGLDVTADALDSSTDNQDFYFMVLRDDASSLQYGSYFGGEISREHVDGGTSRFDRKGVIYQAICAGCPTCNNCPSNQDFPTVPADSIGIWTNNSNGGCNLGLVKYDFLPPSIIADFTIPDFSCAPVDLNFQNTSSTAFNDTSQSLFIWQVNDSIIESYHLDFSFEESGTYTISLLAIDSTSCNFKDSLTRQITIIGNSSTLLDTVTTCLGNSVQIGVSPSNGVSYQWTPTDFLSSSTIANPFANPPNDTTYTLIANFDNCSDTLIQPVKIEELMIDISSRDSVCAFDTVSIHGFPQNGVLYTWSPENIIESGQGLPNLVIRPTQPLWIYAQATDENGCETVDSIFLYVITDLPDIEATANPDSIIVGDSTQLLATSIDVNVFAWDENSTLSTTNIENPFAFPTETTDYIVRVENGECPNKDTVTVHVIYPDCIEGTLYVPNAFTPNNDGNNDDFYVRSTLPIDDFYFAVYDRWGQLVFETYDTNEGWNGKFNGMEMSPTSFAWYAEGKCPSGDDFFIKGNVTLIR
ncbi:MAG: T9SS type B sorting domain-containing protein, partial [Chitinophagales bacterium]